jgi:hypothetical protein
LGTPLGGIGTLGWPQSTGNGMWSIGWLFGMVYPSGFLETSCAGEDLRRLSKMKCQRVIKKLYKVRKQKYLSPGTVWSLTDFFSVLKGLERIRLVYNYSSSGLNGILWVPTFPMPTGDSTIL